MNLTSTAGELDGRTTPDAIADSELQQLAVEAGVAKAGADLTAAQRRFADLVADRCAGIVDRYEVDGCNAGEEIRAAFSLG